MHELHDAVMLGDADAVRVALEDGADVNDRDVADRTPLMYAAADGNQTIAEMLIDHGCEVNAYDRAGSTALHAASQQQHVELVRLLLQAGAFINAVDKDGNTPLFKAVFYSEGRGEVIELLLSSGADRNIRNNSGVSALSLAFTIANFDVRRFFGS